MARRKNNKKGGAKTQTPLYVGGGVLAAALVGFIAFSGGSSKSHASKAAESFRVADYRMNASRFTNNHYRITGRVENIETLGNDRLVAVSIPGSDRERLPLLVRSGVAGNVNLTRGDSFVFDVDCCTGRDEDMKEIKGVLVVRNVETK